MKKFIVLYHMPASAMENMPEEIGSLSDAISMYLQEQVRLNAFPN